MPLRHSSVPLASHVPPPLSSRRSGRRKWVIFGGIAALSLGGLIAIGSRGNLQDQAAAVYRRVRDVQRERSYASQFSPLTVIVPGETSPAAVTVPVDVDPEQERHPISPLIYGMAFAPADYVSDLRLGLNRWGGNDKTRYNWVLGNACNAARDWRFANRVAVTTPGLKEGPSSAADWFVRENRKGGAETLLTVPTIGWVAKDTDNQNVSLNVPAEGGPPVGPDGSIAGYNPASNRARTSVPSFASRKSSSRAASVPGAVYQDEWISHLKRQFGPASAGGVPLYAMDNEPDLWDVTHTDVHPASAGYDELLARFLEYARAVKAVDPSAQVTGPVSWGWTGYHYSPLDRGTDNYRTHADRTRHGGDPFLLWFLKQVRAADTASSASGKTGKRTLDVLDVHYYPQGQGLYNGSETDSSTRERRLRATRALWDPSYRDESWIAQPISLLPLLRRWIAEGYPGTRIGITEWNFGGENDISGALAVAETLGVYGKEDVYLANYWAFPPKGSPAYLAFKLFRNADNSGTGFGDQSFWAQSTQPELVSCYAATDTKSGALTFMLINKMPRTTALVPVKLGRINPTYITPGRVSAWRLDSTAKTLRACPAEELWSAKPATRSVPELKLPPYSITLVRLPRNSQQHLDPMERASQRAPSGAALSN